MDKNVKRCKWYIKQRHTSRQYLSLFLSLCIVTCHPYSTSVIICNVMHKTSLSHFSILHLAPYLSWISDCCSAVTIENKFTRIRCGNILQISAQCVSRFVVFSANYTCTASRKLLYIVCWFLVSFVLIHNIASKAHKLWFWKNRNKICCRIWFVACV